jgi:hypothetical protein
MTGEKTNKLLKFAGLEESDESHPLDSEEKIEELKRQLRSELLPWAREMQKKRIGSREAASRKVVD